MKHSPIVIRRTTESDWKELRAQRLEMLEDTPDAFGERLEAALQHPETEWRMRAARGSSASSIGLVALSGSTWVGTMGVYVPQFETEALLVGVYVSPRFRGAKAGVADALLEASENWARHRGTTLALHVHEDNGRARAYYAKRGFHETGQKIPYLLDAAQNELVMVKSLSE